MDYDARVIKQLAPDLWIVDDAMPLPKGMFPFALPAFLGKSTLRMTIVRLSDGGVLVHSPVRHHERVVEAVRAIGPVRFIVGPCVMHTTFLRPWHALFPDAKLVVAPRTQRRIASFAGVPELDDNAPLAPDDLEQVYMDGHTNRETLFLHKWSRTLIATDFVYNIGANTGLGEAAWLRIAGVRNPLGVTRQTRKGVRKPDAFAPKLERLLSWDFDRLIMSHGDVIERGGKAALARVWSKP